MNFLWLFALGINRFSVVGLGIVLFLFFTIITHAILGRTSQQLIFLNFLYIDLLISQNITWYYLLHIHSIFYLFVLHLTWFHRICSSLKRDSWILRRFSYLFIIQMKLVLIQILLIFVCGNVSEFISEILRRLIILTLQISLFLIFNKLLI